MVADEITKIDTKMVINSIFRQQNGQFELVAVLMIMLVVDQLGGGGCCWGVGRQVGGGGGHQVTKTYKDMDREKNLGSKLLSVMIVLVLEVVLEVIDVVQQVMDMGMKKVKDKVTSEVAKVDKDMMGSRIQGQI